MLTKWNKIPSVLKMVCGLILGAVLGLVANEWTWIGIFGDLFVGALKALAPVLVFFLISSAIGKATAGIGKRFRTVVILYMVTTFTAAIVSVIASYAFPITFTLADAAVDMAPPGNLGEVFKTLLSNLVMNPISAMTSGNYLGILMWAVIFGITLKKVAKPSTIDTISDVANAISEGVKLVISFAPFGIMGLVYEAVTQNGLEIFSSYGKLLLVLVGSMAVASLIINPFIIAITLKRNPYPLVFTCLRESGITAFFTRSSAANIPVNMELCEKLGLDSDFYSVSIPLGSTINMDGAAVTIAVMTLAMCNTMGISVNPVMALLLIVVSVFGACGASGVAGGSLLLIPMACSLFGISNDIAMQAVAVGFIIGVVQDSVETALNSSGDAIFTATAEYLDRKKRGEDMKFLGDFAKK